MIMQIQQSQAKYQKQVRTNCFVSLRLCCKPIYIIILCQYRMQQSSCHQWQKSISWKNLTIKYSYLQPFNLFMMEILCEHSYVEGSVYTYQCQNKQGISKRIIKDLHQKDVEFVLNESCKPPTLKISLTETVHTTIYVNHDSQASIRFRQQLAVKTTNVLIEKLKGQDQIMFKQLVKYKNQCSSSYENQWFVSKENQCQSSKIEHKSSEVDASMISYLEQSQMSFAGDKQGKKVQDLPKQSQVSKSSSSKNIDFSLGTSSYDSFEQPNKPNVQLFRECITTGKNKSYRFTPMPNLPFVVDPLSPDYQKFKIVSEKLVKFKENNEYSQVLGVNSDNLKRFQFDVTFTNIQSECGIGIRSKQSKHVIYFTNLGTLIMLHIYHKGVESNIQVDVSPNNQHGLFKKNQKVSVAVDLYQGRVTWLAAGKPIFQTEFSLNRLKNIKWVPFVQKLTKPCEFVVDGYGII